MEPNICPLLPLRVGVTTRAMFDLTEEHATFERDGHQAYSRLQRERERVLLKPGAAFEVTRQLLGLNNQHAHPIVEVILLSQNSPDLSLRAFNSFEYYDLPIRHGSFTSGRSVAPFVKAWDIDLFLSNNEKDVRAAVEVGTAAARLGRVPNLAHDDPLDEVRIALDCDGVVFSEESEKVYRESGIERFLKLERDNACVAMERGVFGSTFLPKLARLRDLCRKADGTSRVRIAIVTARNAPAHERVIQTLREWGTPADEAHFVGEHDKGTILKAIRAHIFFDDKEKHVTSASGVVPTGWVPLPLTARPCSNRTLDLKVAGPP